MTTKNEAEVEATLQKKGLNAPRLSPEDIDRVIVGETFTTMPSGKCVVCELMLANGFTVRGECATVSIENFDEEVAQRISRDRARQKVWELEGYLLQERLHQKNQIL